MDRKYKSQTRNTICPKSWDTWSSSVTTFVLVVKLYLAWLILSRVGMGGGWWESVVGKSDSKENLKSNLDLDQGFVNMTAATIKIVRLSFSLRLTNRSKLVLIFD